MDVNNIALCGRCPNSSKINKASEEFKELKKTLPPGYEYCLCELLVGDKEPFQTSLKLKITTEKEAKSWLRQYQELTRTTWRTRYTYPNTGRKLICRLERLCHHNTRPKVDPSQNRRSKNTGCPAFLNIRVKKLIFERQGYIRHCRSTDPHLPNWPSSVIFTGTHNHPIDDASVLSHRDVSHSVKMKLIKLFEDGYSATEALKKHKDDLAREHGEEYDKVIADRHFCPDTQFCYRLYYDIFRKDTKSLSRRKVQELLEERISKYNSENGVCISSQNVGGESVVAVVTPLMKRVHDMIPSAGQTVFVNNFVIGPGYPLLFMLLTDSCAGGLPLGCFIVGSESSDAIRQGLEMIHQLLGVGAYNGRGRNGPEVFITSNSEAERSALSQIYPSAKQVLCVFHILQAFWQFLFGVQNQIEESDRYYLFQQMKELACCSSENEVQIKFNSLIKDSIVLKYHFIVSNFKEVFESRMHWALFHLDLDGLALLTNASNNFCNAMLVLKDRPEKLKSTNTFQLLDLVLSRVNRLCKNRLEDLAAGKLPRVLACRYVHIKCLSAFDKNFIIEEQPLVFTMPMKEKSYEPRVYVDMNMGFCSCTTGITGGPCRHQYILIRYFNIKKWKFDHVLTDTASKKLLTTIAQGDPLTELDQLFTRFKEFFERDPSRFAQPLGSFILKWAHYKTDEDLVDALRAFTKSSHNGQAKRKIGESSAAGENGTKKNRVDAESSGVCEVQHAMEVIASAQESQLAVPVVKHETNGQRVTLPTMSMEHEALSGLANMAEQAQKIGRTDCMKGPPSAGKSADQGISQDQHMENLVQGADRDNNSESIIVELISYQ